MLQESAHHTCLRDRRALLTLRTLRLHALISLLALPASGTLHSL